MYYVWYMFSTFTIEQYQKTTIHLGKYAIVPWMVWESSLS